MRRSGKPDITADDIRAHMESIHCHGENDFLEKSLSDVDLKSFDRDIALAWEDADAGTRNLSMQRFPWPFRPLARIAGRVVLLIATVFTFQQRRFNHSIVLLITKIICHVREGGSKILDLEKSFRIQAESLLEQKKLLQNQEKSLKENGRMIAAHGILFSEQKKLILSLEQSVSDLKEEIVDLRAALSVKIRSFDLRQKVCPEGVGENNAFLALKGDEGAQYDLDLFYSSFTNRFRGSKELIKKRSMGYLPVIREAFKNDENARLLDIGCGRGEWLELIKESRLNGFGIDLNEIMVQKCIDNGLSVSKEDALSCLGKLADNSLRAVTGFHIIEHLPFETLIHLFRESLRVLKRGGVVIFETPNPGNVLVGSNNFYYDPTHGNPLPSGLVQFTAEHLNFKRVEIRYLNPPETEPVSEATPLASLYNNHFNAPMDYAVIGWKD